MSKIGVFDSGFGGLTVLKGIREALPAYDYIYLGDSARTPYGTRSQDVVYKFTEQAVDFLFKQGCELIIIACNTASSEALRKIQQEYLAENHPDKRVLGVVIPACEQVVDSGYKKIGVMATASTVDSGSYVREIGKLDSNVEIIQQPCPLLVPIIESGESHKDVLDVVLEDYIRKIQNVDAVILGCTHYEIIEEKIKKHLRNSQVVSQSKIVAEKLSDYLGRHTEIEKKLSKEGSIKYFSTDLTNRFQGFGSNIIGEDVKVSKVSLE